MKQRKSFPKVKKQKSLRTKIIRISCTFVLLALLLGDVWIYVMNYRSLYSEGRQRAYQNMQNLMEELIRNNAYEIKDENVWRYWFSNYMKNEFDVTLSMERDYNLCFEVKEWNGKTIHAKEIYNHTVFAYEDLESLTYKTYDDRERLSYVGSVLYAPLTWGGRQYLVVRGTLWNNDNMRMFHIEDVTYIRENLKNMIWILLGVTLVLTILVGFAQAVILRHVLAPLKELNETTKRMSENIYDQRIEVMQRDEIGELAKSFNAMADAVEARTRSLEESEHRKTLLMGNLTHELKTPMTAISGYAEILLTTKLTEEDQQEALQYIYEECGRMERLSKKMMKLLSLEAINRSETESDAGYETKSAVGNDEFVMRDVAAEALFQEAERVCGKAIEDKHIILERETHGERFLVERDLMVEVMINLIDNAVKASPKGERVILRADGDTISVQDFGCGIPKDETERILEPFYMVDKSRSRKSGGAGLGLSIVSMIVKLHKGSLLIQSEVGQGTTVTLQMQRNSK